MSDVFLGEIRLFAGTLPPNFYPCDGRELDIAPNAALFSLIGTKYGGDGATTFGLPDLQGRVMVGAEDLSSIGAKLGVETIELSSGTLPGHIHAVSSPSASAMVQIPANTGQGAYKIPYVGGVLSTTLDSEPGAEVNIYGKGPGDTTLQPFSIQGNGTTGDTGVAQEVSIRNPGLGLNYGIAYRGAFPPRG